tara:strand:+ start:44 stop:622 length:579 start_codon:yes stop_codon:yes gene_type:complete
MVNPYAKQWAKNIGSNIASAAKSVANVPFVDVSIKRQTSAEQGAKRATGVTGTYWTGPQLSVTRDKSPNIPKGQGCRDGGSVNLGTPPGTGGGGGGRTVTNATTSTPPAWSGNEPDCPIRSQESIDNFTTNAPKKRKPTGVKITSPPKNADKPTTETPKSEKPSGGKKYNPSGLPKWSEEGLWGQYRPKGGK